MRHLKKSILFLTVLFACLALYALLSPDRGEGAKGPQQQRWIPSAMAGTPCGHNGTKRARPKGSDRISPDRQDPFGRKPLVGPISAREHPSGEKGGRAPLGGLYYLADPIGCEKPPSKWKI